MDLGCVGCALMTVHRLSLVKQASQVTEDQHICPQEGLTQARPCCRLPPTRIIHVITDDEHRLQRKCRSHPEAIILKPDRRGMSYICDQLLKDCTQTEASNRNHETCNTKV